MLEFQEDGHIYTIDGKELMSVTTWIEQFVPPFNANIVSSVMSRKSDMSPEEIRAKWNLKGKIACDWGNAIHGALEYYIKYGEMVGSQQLRDIVANWDEVNDGKKVFSEVIVYDKDSGLAGTIDQVVQIKDKIVDLRDTKTNEDIHKKSKGRLKEPFKELSNNSISKYTIQLSIYKFLIELHGYTVRNTEIWYLNEGKWEIIKVEPLKIRSIIKAYAKNN